MALFRVDDLLLQFEITRRRPGVVKQSGERTRDEYGQRGKGSEASAEPAGSGVLAFRQAERVSPSEGLCECRRVTSDSPAQQAEQYGQGRHTDSSLEMRTYKIPRHP